MSAWPLLLLFLLGGRRPEPPPPVVYLRMSVAGDDVGARALQLLEGRGIIKQMMNFDGESLEVLWQGPGLALDALEAIPGVTLLEARIAVPKN